MITSLSAWMADSLDDVPDPFTGGADDSPFRSFAPLIILAVIGFAVIIFFGIRASHRDQARIVGLQAWTQQRDYTFSPDEPDLARLYSNLPFRSGGRRLRFEHVVRGRLAGRAFTAFDYSYETTSSSTGSDGRSSSSTTTHRVQVVAVDGPSGWPAVRVVPQGLGSKLAVMFGRQDVKVGHEAFDRAFRVRADDEAAARALLAPMASALLARTDQEFWVDGSTVLALRRGTLESTDLETWLDQLKAVLAQAPVQDR